LGQIGSAQEAGTQRNPFNGKERALMWKGYLKENEIKHVRIIQVIDGKSWNGSVRNLLRLAKFDILFTDKKSISKASKGRFKVEKIKRVGELSSTQIRKAIASDKAWEHLTGKAVVKTIKRFGGQARIKQIFKMS
jgi:nicotinamide mononucleotide adenylyltransferase